MRFTLLLTAILMLIILDSSAQTNGDKITELLGNVLKIDKDKINADRPIANINLLAAQQSDTMIVLTKQNINDVFSMAKTYESCIISVERHTILLIDSWSNCIQSGSWGYCMPHGVGFIQRGEMTKKEDFINNIIGVPDSQRRTVFLIKKK